MGLASAGIYRELANTCVSLFFMITAHLFIGKLLDARMRPIDWTALFVSRALRLTPLYLLAMAALFTLVAVLSGWQLRVPLCLASLLRLTGFGLLVLAAAWVAMFGHAPNAVVAVVVLAGFCIVACGNTVFGLLSNRAAVMLGDISYGVYLLHGLLLSLTFMFLLGSERAAAMGPAMHWAVATSVGAGVVIAAALTYRFVEAPAMKQVKQMTAWIHRSRPARALST